VHKPSERAPRPGTSRPPGGKTYTTHTPRLTGADKRPIGAQRPAGAKRKPVRDK
jgi:hypothetical protein